MELFVCESPGIYRVAGADEALAGAQAALRRKFGTRPALSGAEESKRFFWARLSGQEREIFSVAFLDTQMRVIACEDLFMGTIDQTSVYPREVLKSALQHNAASVLLAHNHPSGDPEPSEADRRITKIISDAMLLINVRVKDHIVVGRSECVSFVERGFI